MVATWLDKRLVCNGGPAALAILHCWQLIYIVLDVWTQLGLPVHSAMVLKKPGPPVSGTRPGSEEDIA